MGKKHQLFDQNTAVGKRLAVFNLAISRKRPTDFLKIFQFERKKWGTFGQNLVSFTISILREVELASTFRFFQFKKGLFEPISNGFL